MGSGGITNFIGGTWRADAAGEIKPVRSPIDGSAIGTMSCSSRQAATEAIAAARQAQPASRYIEEMPTGIVNINDTSNYWELHIPFGGMSGKNSGTGRVDGRDAPTAMCDLKSAIFLVK